MDLQIIATKDCHSYVHVDNDESSTMTIALKVMKEDRLNSQEELDDSPCGLNADSANDLRDDFYEDDVQISIVDGDDGLILMSI